MKLETSITPPNSIILVMDPQAGCAPDSFGGQLVVATPSCVAIGTLSEQEGKTTIILTDELSQHVVPGESLVFDDSIAVSDDVLAIMTALNEIVLSLPVHPGNVRIRIWVNDSSEPNRIVIAAG